MKKMLLTLIAAIAAGTLCAAEANVNGTFEKCAPDQQGNLLPEGWIINKGSTKKAAISITKEDDEKRTGNFGLRTEVDKDGSAFLTFYPALAVQPGDTLIMKGYVKGKGKMGFGMINNGTTSKGKGQFLGTAVWPLKELNSPDQWQLIEYKYEVKPLEFGGEKATPEMINPVIYATGEGELYFDDYVLDIVPQEKK